MISSPGVRAWHYAEQDVFHNHGLAGIGWCWWALVGAPPPLTPEKDGTSHQIQSNGRFGSDLV
ncbi:hypothetical protein CDCE8392_0083 [Corynebacterium diphtheriae CDCE 8392]|nr:hypothetical protein CDCE8392_0083 [Corynebacterium diphtheriae CDCE 8392]